MLTHSLPYSGAASTITGALKDHFRSQQLTRHVGFCCNVPDDAHHHVQLRGRLHQHGNKRLVLALHGLGGSAESSYLYHAVAACERLGADCLRLSMRGADGKGPDFYNAALSRDIATALAAPELKQYQSIYLLGYSFGGHLALHFGCTQTDTRVKGIGTICAPMDLKAASDAFSANQYSLFSIYILRALKKTYASLDATEHLPLPKSGLRTLGTIREWDEAITVPRFGFQSAEHYYEQCSVHNMIEDLAYPTVVVTTADDPIVPHHVQRRTLFRLPSQAVHVELAGGGHVGTGAKLDLGETAPLGLESQLLRRLFRC